MEPLWNIFGPFVIIISRINFLVDLIPSDSYLKYKVAAEREIRRGFPDEDGRLDGSKLERVLPLVEDMSARASRADCRECKICLQNRCTCDKSFNGKESHDVAPISTDTIEKSEKYNVLVRRSGIVVRSESVIPVILFILHVLLSLYLTTILFVCSLNRTTSRGFSGTSSSGKLAKTNSEQSEWLLIRLLMQDMFSGFESSRSLNRIHLALMLPAVVIRLKTLLAMIADRKMKPADNAPEKILNINVVQLYISYIATLKADGLNWLRIVKDGWYHRRSTRCSQTSRTVRNGLFDCSYSEMSLKSKLYFYNLIDFNRCCSGHFFRNSIDQDVKEPEGSDEDCNVEIESNGLGDQNPTSRSAAEIFPKLYLDQQARPSRLARETGSKIEANGPPLSHRIDLRDMGWLVVIVIVLYVCSIGSVVGPTYFSILRELEIVSPDEPRRIETQNELARSQKRVDLVRVALIAAVETLINLSISDLFCFYVCIIFCFSRAGYMRGYLKRVEELCELVKRLTSHNERTRLLRPTGLSNLDLGKDSDFPKTQTVFSYSTRTTIRDEEKDLKSHQGYTRNINNRVEYSIEIVLLLQRELLDMKRYFNLYLNLQFVARVVGASFALATLLDSKGTNELALAAINLIDCFVPFVFIFSGAALVESEFRAICGSMDRLLICGRRIIALKNVKRIMRVSSCLAIPSNRGFVALGNFHLASGSLAPLIGWIATGAVLFMR